MSLTEREKEIAQEFGIPLRDADGFLSRIREEQEVIAYYAQVHHEEMTDDALFFSVEAADKWIGCGKAISEIHPLFTIPPAAPESDCKELVADAERYRFIASSKSEGSIDLTVCRVYWDMNSYDILTEERANAAIDAALAKHKASMGEK